MTLAVEQPAYSLTDEGAFHAKYATGPRFHFQHIACVLPYNRIGMPEGIQHCIDRLRRGASFTV